MNLFIDTPERAAGRMERRRQGAGCEPSAPTGEAVCPSSAVFGPASLFEPSQGTVVVGPELLDLDEPSGFEDADAPAESGRDCRSIRKRRRRGRMGRRSSVRERIPGGESSDGRAGPEPQSIAAEAYREEKTYDRRRTRKRKLAGVLRVLATIVLLPLALTAVFLGSYALTCILNGASLDEVVQLIGELLARMQEFANDAAGFW